MKTRRKFKKDSIFFLIIIHVINSWNECGDIFSLCISVFRMLQTNFVIFYNNV